MNFVWDKIAEWLKGLLVSVILGNLSGLFESINAFCGRRLPQNARIGG